MIRPLTGQILITLVPREERTASGIELPNVTLSPDEVQFRSRAPEPPPPEIGVVEAIGPWPIKGGKYDLPPFGIGAKVVVRPGAGQKLSRGIGERLKLVSTDQVLAVLS